MKSKEMNYLEISLSVTLKFSVRQIDAILSKQIEDRETLGIAKNYCKVKGISESPKKQSRYQRKSVHCK